MAHDGPLPRWGDNESARERLLFFSDAVFAIAITLLALEIGLPEVDPTHAAADLPRAVLVKLPNILAFALSFLVIGLYWQRHLLLFHYILRYDLPLLWLNLLVLLVIAFVPFPTGLIAHYGNTRFAVIFYAATLAVVGLLLAAEWGYATWRHRLVPPELPRGIVRTTAAQLLVVAGIFLASIGLAFVHPTVAKVSWPLVLLVRPTFALLSA
jgi:uncharacterized membrane protein